MAYWWILAIILFRSCHSQYYLHNVHCKILDHVGSQSDEADELYEDYDDISYNDDDIDMSFVDQPKYLVDGTNGRNDHILAQNDQYDINKPFKKLLRRLHQDDNVKSSIDKDEKRKEKLALNVRDYGEGSEGIFDHIAHPKGVAKADLSGYDKNVGYCGTGGAISTKANKHLCDECSSVYNDFNLCCYAHDNCYTNQWGREYCDKIFCHCLNVIPGNECTSKRGTYCWAVKTFGRIPYLRSGNGISPKPRPPLPDWYESKPITKQIAFTVTEAPPNEVPKKNTAIKPYNKDKWYCGSDGTSKQMSIMNVLLNCFDIQNEFNLCCYAHDNCYTNQWGQEYCDKVFCHCLNVILGDKCAVERNTFCEVLKGWGGSAYHKSDNGTSVIPMPPLPGWYTAEPTSIEPEVLSTTTVTSITTVNDTVTSSSRNDTTSVITVIKDNRDEWSCGYLGTGSDNLFKIVKFLCPEDKQSFNQCCVSHIGCYAAQLSQERCDAAFCDCLSTIDGNGCEQEKGTYCNMARNHGAELYNQLGNNTSATPRPIPKSQTTTLVYDYNLQFDLSVFCSSNYLSPSIAIFIVIYLII
ncbi:unnamed protein product [Bursaphelenchus okinawaensis]|uniref:Phospholipase A(2) n=1 Tax=Bursaphelenchus okinawaensis TaxID=465554 RepID=A0A811JQ87_9BILA|nr:unnamed protein product [Bursaphelenchus okinawaensis]CAG9077139.1 unnamed protein product [Bursaphelenchus okinawaensis]